MAILPNGLNLSQAFVGNTEIQSAWLGNTKIWEKSGGRLPEGYTEVTAIYATTESHSNYISAKLTISDTQTIKYRTAFTVWHIRLIEFQTNNGGFIGYAYASQYGFHRYSFHDCLGSIDYNYHDFKLVSKNSSCTYYKDNIAIGSESKAITDKVLTGKFLEGNPDAGYNPVSGVRFYEVENYDQDTGVYYEHYIPCYRNSDNKIGMYEIVGNQFYPANTDNFSYDA